MKEGIYRFKEHYLEYITYEKNPNTGFFLHVPSNAPARVGDKGGIALDGTSYCMEQFEQEAELVDYKEFVNALAKHGNDILKSLTPTKCDALHMSFALPIEASELADAFKKYIIYEKDLDRENVLEELGDIEFYLQRIYHLTGFTREDAIIANQKKLMKRYHSLKYTNKHAQERADKV